MSSSGPSLSPSSIAVVSSIPTPESIATSQSTIMSSSSSLPSASSSTPPPTSSSSPSTSSPTSSTTASTTHSTTRSTTRPTSNTPSSSPDRPTSQQSAPPPPPLVTLPSVIVITTTDSQGHTITSTPTTTEIKINPTLSPDGRNSSRGSSFFKNTGAVAGVFVLIGLAAAAIVLWILFALRRQRRDRQLKHDTAVSATLAAAGFHRTPLDDEDDPGTGSRHSKAFGSADVQMRSTSALALATTSSSFPSAGGRTSGYQDDAEVYNPYVDYDAGAGPKDAHGLSRPYTPPPTAFAEHYRNLSSPEARDWSFCVSQWRELRASACIIQTAVACISSIVGGTAAPLLRPPPPLQKFVVTVARLRYTLRRAPAGTSDWTPIFAIVIYETDQDYSRRVLGVRNIPDGVSQISSQ
ncbi:hypothetical protein C8J57DRAFT_1490947 [Mycena rebaudengoi]|nr:hypothetical protein C8J57DRAFT_1490947 [Mycena rebaudengoi]